MDTGARPTAELELLGNHAARHSRVAEGLGLVDRLPVDGEVGGQAHAVIRPRRLGIPLVGEDEPLVGGKDERCQLEPGRAHELLGEGAADRIGDVGLAPLEHGEPGRVLRDDAEDEALDRGSLAPVRLEGFQHQLDAGRKGHELVGPGAHWRFLVPVVPDLLDVLLGNDPAGAGGARVEGEEVGPRRLEAEAHAAGIGCLDTGHPVLERLRGGALVALVGELHVLSGDRLTVVELRALPQDEVVGEPVLGHRPRLGEARGLRVAGHRLEHGIVERVEEHVRRDDARRLGGVEPRRRDRHVDGPRELPLGGGRRGRRDKQSQEQQHDNQSSSGHGSLLCIAKRSGSEAEG